MSSLRKRPSQLVDEDGDASVDDRFYVHLENIDYDLSTFDGARQSSHREIVLQFLIIVII